MIGGALRKKEYPGVMLNPHGKLIDAPFWVFARLEKLNLLERDRQSGIFRIQKVAIPLMEIFDGPDFRPGLPIRAYDPGRIRVRCDDSGYRGAFMAILGRDCAGLPHKAVEQTRELESDLDHTLHPSFVDAAAVEVVRDVKRSRKRKRRR